MKHDYKNKMQKTKKRKFCDLDSSERDLLKARYRTHKSVAYKVKANPWPWHVWIERQGY